MLSINQFQCFFLVQLRACLAGMQVLLPLPTGQAGLWLNFRAPHFATKAQ